MSDSAQKSPRGRELKKATTSPAALKSPKTPSSKATPDSSSNSTGEAVKKYESKRIKKKAIPFDPDDSPTVVQKSRKSTEPAAKSKKHSGKEEKDEGQKELLYRRGDFVAVRNEEDGFYVCRTQQNVFGNTQEFAIQWLEKDETSTATTSGGDEIYDLGSLERIAFQCVLIEVKMQRVGKDKFKLVTAQIEKVKECLEESIEGKLKSTTSKSEAKGKAKAPAKGKKVEEDDGDEADNDEDNEDTDEPQAKKAKISNSSVKKVTAKKQKTSSTPAATPKNSKRRVNGNKSESESPPEKTRKALKGMLIPRPSLIVWEKDPYIYSSEEVPYISSSSHSKLLFRAVYSEDHNLLKKLISDRKHIARLDLPHSVSCRFDPLQIALINNDVNAVQLLASELFPDPNKKQEPRVSVTSSILARESTGRYNRLSLGGVRYIRPVALSRGSREGNNAFTKDYEYTSGDINSYIDTALSMGVNKKTLDVFLMAIKEHASNQYSTPQQRVFDRIYVAVSNGHRKLAAELMEDQIKSGVNYFSYLHKPVLQYDGEELPTGIRAASVKKRPWENKKITPLHCAAINPNPKYLSKLLQILPEYSIQDGAMKRIIHYAAVCESTGPLELLLNRNVNPDEVDGSGMSALMLACKAGRVKNVELLLSRAKKDLEAATAESNKASKSAKAKEGLSDDDDEVDDDEDDNDDEGKKPMLDKYGLGGIDRSIVKPQNVLFSYCPIHIAASLGYTDVIEVLLKYGVKVDKELSASKDKMTALMVAASHGYLDIIRILVQNGAKLTAKDKLKRTALVHAAMNGHAHVVSYLLHQGLDPNQSDSSGNTVLHYAVGYGWYYCTKALLQAGANPNASNDWKSTPLAIAFMKGHMGLADLLLEQPKVDINCRLDQGMTLVSVACGSPLEDDIVEQLEYLVKNKKADCTLSDAQGMNALHHLGANLIKNCRNYAEGKTKSVEMAELLIENGCDPSAKDSNGMTPVMYAIQSANDALVRCLCNRASAVSDACDADNQNILHYLSIHCMAQPQDAINSMISNSSVDKSVLEQMARQVDINGFTPLHVACHRYMTWTGVVDANPTSADQPESDDNDNSDVSAADDDDDEPEPLEDDDEKEGHEEEMEEDNEVGKQDDEDDGDGSPQRVDKAPSISVVNALGLTNILQSAAINHGEGSKEYEAAKKAVSKQKLAADQWKAKQDYIKILYELCPAVAEQPIEKRRLKPTDKKPEKEEDCYVKQVGGFSPLHFLINVSCESTLLKSLAASADAASAAGRSSEGQIVLKSGLDALLECIKKRKELTKSDHLSRALNVYSVSGATPLLAAILQGEEAKAISLIKAGADVNAKLRDKKQNKNATALLLACSTGLHALIPVLIQHGANVHDRLQRNVHTPLHVLFHNPVCKSKKQIKLKDSVKALLDAGCNPLLVDKHLKTPLHTLVEHCRDCPDVVEVATLLVKAGIPINSPDRRGRTALHLSVNANVGGANSSIVLEQFLLDNGADVLAHDMKQRLPIHYVFVEIGKPVNTTALDPVELCTTLTAAASASGLDGVRSMVNHEDDMGMTPLHLAACRGAGVCCIHLVQKGASVNVRNAEGNTPLSLAVTHGHDSCTILLLQRNADISVNIVVPPLPPKNSKSASDDSERDDDDEVDDEDEEKKKTKKETKPAWLWKPLRKTDKAAETRSYSLFQGVISKDWQGITFMMLDLLDNFKLTLTTVIEAALVTNKYHLALSLIRKVKGGGSELTVQLSHSQSLAHVLAKSSTADSGSGELITQVAETLLGRSVDFNRVDGFGCTPLHYACVQANKPLVAFILGKVGGVKCLAVTDKLGRTPLAATFWRLGHKIDSFIMTIARLLIRDHKADPNVLCAYPNQQLYHYGYKQTADEEDYVRPNASYSDVSPLMLAIGQHNFDLTRELLLLGANVNFSDASGRTPLMLAVSENAVDIVRLLLDHYYIKPEHEDEDDDEYRRAEESKKQGEAAGLVKKPSRRRFGLALQRQGSIARSTSGGKKMSGSSSAAQAEEEIESGLIAELNLQVKTYPRTSEVNVRAVDDRCRSVLHYLVRSFPNGSYDNYKLLIQLVAVGAPLEQADGGGQTVLDYALAHGLPRLSTAIQCLLVKQQQDQHKASPIKSFSKPKRSRTEAQDGLDWTGLPVPDFRADSDQQLANIEKEELQQQQQLKQQNVELKPDEKLSLASSGQVMLDTDQDAPYDILLFKIDVSAGAWGLYNFYKMQIVHEKGKDLYILFTKWGRIGDEGQYQQTPFPHLDDAVKEFRKIFKAKTGNDWSNFKTFEMKERKYRLVPLEERLFKRAQTVRKVDISLPTDTNKQHPSKLNQYVQDMIKELTNVTSLTRALEQVGVDRDEMPLGRVKKETLLKAKKILSEIDSSVKTVQKLRQTHPITDLDAYKTELEKIAKLTNEYYHLIPRSGYEYERIPVLDSPNLLEKEWKNLETLIDMELTSKMMLGAMHRINEVNPLDYIYRCLKCQIELLNENDTVSQYILRYVSETYSGKVEAIYCVSRQGEDKRLDTCSNDNHRLLFHGSSSSNLLSILSKGLLIAPTNAPATGYRFGKGLYTADRFSKSEAYCYNYAVDSKTKFMLVCEVALGKVKDLYSTYGQTVEPNEEFDSVRAVGSEGPDPLFDVTLPTGAVIPLGATKKKHLPAGVWISLTDSEYIVYRQEQVCLRYIVQFNESDD